MPFSKTVHDLLADACEYPAAAAGKDLGATLDALAAEAPQLGRLTAALRESARRGAGSELEESYARTFDNTAERAPELGWHVFGEAYARGAFLARLRGEMRRLGVEETVELPDHMSHILRMLARLEPESAAFLASGVACPALAKLAEAVEPANPWRGVIDAAAAVAASHATVTESTDV